MWSFTLLFSEKLPVRTELLHKHSVLEKSQIEINFSFFSFLFFHLNEHRLAASEIAKFQDQLIKRLIDDMSSQMETLSPSTGAITVSTHQLTPGVVYDYDWNFARAFLYSLTVLTTIGEFEWFFYSSSCFYRLIYDVNRRFLSTKLRSSSNFR